MPDNSISVSDARRSGVRLVVLGIAAIVAILITAAVFLVMDPARCQRIQRARRTIVRRGRSDLANRNPVA